jgi:glycosyltransferase involved in cell wall biosynthesis
VTVTGWLERGDVGDLLRDSDVFVLPSYAEGMAISVLEAMAWGLAVITTDAGGSESFLDDRRNCLLVKPGDISGICDAIRNVYENPELRLSLGQQARTTAEGLSIDRYVHALSIIYQKTAKSTVPPPDSLRDRKPTLTHSFTK